MPEKGTKTQTSKAAAKHRHSLAGLLVFAFASSFAVPVAAAQSGVPNGGSAPLIFDTVSIRSGKRTPDSKSLVTPDGYVAKGFPLQWTILVAYFPPPGFKHYAQLRGAPSWVEEETYDIDARIAPADAARWQKLNENLIRGSAPELQAMLKTMLAERCNLHVHEEVADRTGYAMTIGAKDRQGLASETGTALPSKGATLADGGMVVYSKEDGEDVATFYNTSMAALTDWLNLVGENPITDQTGLKGKYHFSLRRVALSSTSDPMPGVMWRLEDIGIKLQRQRVPSKILYIDSIERPSSN